jgi:hypothetical protein
VTAELPGDYPTEFERTLLPVVPWRVLLSTGDALSVSLPADWAPGGDWSTAAGFLLLNGSWVSLAHIVRIERVG